MQPEQKKESSGFDSVLVDSEVAGAPWNLTPEQEQNAKQWQTLFDRLEPSYRIGAGRGRPGSGPYHIHEGVDFYAVLGTPVSSCLEGEVIIARELGGYGKTVVVRSEDFEGKRVDAVYAHLNSIEVEEGCLLSAGEMLGQVGCSGTSKPCHLHLEFIEEGEVVVNAQGRLRKGKKGETPLDGPEYVQATFYSQRLYDKKIWPQDYWPGFAWQDKERIAHKLGYTVINPENWRAVKEGKVHPPLASK